MPRKVKPLTADDHTILGVIPVQGAYVLSIAEALHREPFALTAKLKSLERRGVLLRVDGIWTKRPENEWHTRVPDDSQVPMVDSVGWEALERGGRNLFVRSDGAEFVEAQPWEDAELIIESKVLRGLRLVRAHPVPDDAGD